MWWSRVYSCASGQANPEAPACHSNSQSHLNQNSYSATRTICFTHIWCRFGQRCRSFLISRCFKSKRKTKSLITSRYIIRENVRLTFSQCDNDKVLRLFLSLCFRVRRRTRRLFPTNGFPSNTYATFVLHLINTCNEQNRMEGKHPLLITFENIFF
jgi:hypothetical protein